MSFTRLSHGLRVPPGRGQGVRLSRPVTPTLAALGLGVLRGPSAGMGRFPAARRPGWSAGPLPSLRFFRPWFSAASGQLRGGWGWGWAASTGGVEPRGGRASVRTPRLCVVGARCRFTVQGASPEHRPKTTMLVPTRPVAPGPSSATSDRQQRGRQTCTVLPEGTSPPASPQTPSGLSLACVAKWERPWTLEERARAAHLCPGSPHGVARAACRQP